MKYRKFFLIFALGCSVQASAPNAPGDNPYLKIAGRNSFGLATPPPPPMIQDAKTPSAEIILNGIMAVFDDKRALFKVRESSGKEKSCILSEGQRDGDIELLSVDIKRNTITVDNHGVIQTIAISETSVFLPAGNPVLANGGVNPAANHTPNISIIPDQTPASQIQTANGRPETSQSGYQVGGYQTGSPNSKTTSSNDASANGSQNLGGANSGATKIDPWWIRGSKMIEQARADSANAVLNGTADPQPLTPLTPPGTPADLIGSGQLFFEHM